MSVPASLKEHGLLSPGEVAEETGRHRSTIWQWMEQFNAEGNALMPSYFVDPKGELVLYRKGMDRPHYRGIRPVDIQPWHKATGGVSRGGSGGKSKATKRSKKPPSSSSKRRQQRSNSTKG